MYPLKNFSVATSVLVDIMFLLNAMHNPPIVYEVGVNAFVTALSIFFALDNRANGTIPVSAEPAQNIQAEPINFLLVL